MTGAQARSPRFAGSRRGRDTRRQRIRALVAGLVVLAIAVTIAVLRAGPGSGTGGRVNGGAGGVMRAGTAGAASAGAVAAASPAGCGWGTCRVAVNVATLWVKPWSPRPVDGPALTNPAQPRKWIGAMTFSQKLDLVGRVETQALYGTRVTVIGHHVARDGTRWTQVTVPSQPTNRDSRGYPGWVPTRQLTSAAPASATTSAVVRSPTAWLWSGWTSAGVAGSHVMEVSYDTRLPVVRATPSYVLVSMIGGRQVALRRSVLVLHTAGTSWGATRAKVVSEAMKFLGLQYLWGGTSGFGYDCSGFTYSVYHAYGVTLPRDADRQAVHGTSVARASLLPGDLVFYRSYEGGPIGHVGMYVGYRNGGIRSIIDAPQTGQPVKIEPLTSHSYYAGARRYLSQ